MCGNRHVRFYRLTAYFTAGLQKEASDATGVSNTQTAASVSRQSLFNSCKASHAASVHCEGNVGYNLFSVFEDFCTQFPLLQLVCCSRCSNYTTVGSRGIAVRFLTGAKDLSPLPRSQSGATAQQPPVQLVQGTLSVGYGGRSVILANHLRLMLHTCFFTAYTQGHTSTFTYIYSYNVQSGLQ